MKLDKRDRQLIDVMRQDQVLVNTDPVKFNQHAGSIVVCCSDGDQMTDLLKHNVSMAVASGGQVRPHMIANHGGAMLLSDGVQLFEQHDISGLIKTEISQAIQMKKISSVALMVHAPCGASNMIDLDVVDTVDHMMRGKKMLKEYFQNVVFSCFLHVDYGQNRRRTYFVPEDRFEEWYAEYEVLYLGRVAHDLDNPDQIDHNEIDSIEKIERDTMFSRDFSHPAA